MMKEDELFELLSNLDDDLIEEEIDKLLNGVEIDMDSINKKAHEKLNRSGMKMKQRKRFPYAVAACICVLAISTVYADDISSVIKSFFNKTPVYSTIVDGSAYYLKEAYNLNNEIKLESVMVAEGQLEMKLSANIEESQLKDIKVIPKDNPDIFYTIGGYAKEENKYDFSFWNETEQNYHITPFKDFMFEIAGNTFDVSLDAAQSFDSGSKIFTSDTDENSIQGVNMGARMIDENGKLNVQIVTAFEDKDLELVKLGELTQSKEIVRFEDRGEEGMIGSSSGSKVKALYAYDKMGNAYKLEEPEDAKAYPITIFETAAPKNKELTVKVPAILAKYNKEIDSLALSIPSEGQQALNKEVDFTMQKAVIKSIKRVSSTSVELEFELSTGENKNIEIRSFDVYGPDVKKRNAEFEGNKGVMTLEFKSEKDVYNLEILRPEFVMKGDWAINIQP